MIAAHLVLNAKLSVHTKPGNIDLHILFVKVSPLNLWESLNICTLNFTKQDGPECLDNMHYLLC